MRSKPVEQFIESNVAPEVVVILGAGPSVENYKRADHPDAYVIGMNQTAAYFDVDACLYCDGVMNDCRLPDGIDLFRSEQHAESHGGQGYWFLDNITKTGDMDWKGSLGRALWLSVTWGVKRFVVYGCDSVRSRLTTANASMIKRTRPPRHRVLQAYERAAASAIIAEEKHGLDIDWKHLT